MKAIAPVAGIVGVLLVGLLPAMPVSGQVQPARLEAIDSLGNVIGPVVGEIGGLVTATLVVNSHAIRAQVAPDYLLGAGADSVVFASANCSGQAFIHWPDGGLGEPFTIVTRANSVYAGPKAQPQSIQYSSRYDPGIDDCQTGPAKALPNPLSAVPVTFVRDLSPPFRPPFDLRAVPAPGTVPAPAVGLVGLVALATMLAFAAERLLRRVS